MYMFMYKITKILLKYVAWSIMRCFAYMTCFGLKTNYHQILKVQNMNRLYVICKTFYHTPGYVIFVIYYKYLYIKQFLTK